MRRNSVGNEQSSMRSEEDQFKDCRRGARRGRNSSGAPAAPCVVVSQVPLELLYLHGQE